MNPKVSIILSVYNGAEEAGKTIESVLNQTFKDFEFIIIDDGSMDSTQDIIKEYTEKDNRVILLKNEKNVGLTKGLNKGINLAKGKYIARIDVGDLWDKTKLEQQIKFLDENKDYVICGTQAFYIDEDGKILGRSSYKNMDKDIRKNFFTREGIFFHPSIVFRNIKIYYREFFRYSQDLDLYMRLFFKGKLYCLPEPLTYSKLTPLDLTISKRYYQRQYQNIAYKLFKERIKFGKDDLDEGNPPFIKENKIGLRLCNRSMFFILKYIRCRVSGKSPIVWLFWLFLASIIYPPFIVDYWNKFKGIILYKKLKLKPS
jgi:glycosyltransferase involved in cell wall biosynthesis